MIDILSDYERLELRRGETEREVNVLKTTEVNVPKATEVDGE